MTAADGELVIEDAPVGGRRRRVRYVPIEVEPHAYTRIEEEHGPNGWRIVGTRPVHDVDVSDQRTDVRTFAGP